MMSSLIIIKLSSMRTMRRRVRRKEGGGGGATFVFLFAGECEGGWVGGRANKGVCGGVSRLSEPFARRMTVSSGYDCLILVVNTRS